MSAPDVFFEADSPEALTLAVGDTLVLHTGAHPTTRGALAVTYDGTAGSLTFDPASIGNPATLTARRLQKNVPATGVTLGPSTERDVPRVGASREVVRVKAGPSRVLHPTLRTR